MTYPCGYSTWEVDADLGVVRGVECSVVEFGYRKGFTVCFVKNLGIFLFLPSSNDVENSQRSPYLQFT